MVADPHGRERAHERPVRRARGAALARRPDQGRAVGRGGGDLARPALGDLCWSPTAAISSPAISFGSARSRCSRWRRFSPFGAVRSNPPRGRHGCVAPARRAVDASRDFMVISLPYHTREVRSMAAPQSKPTVELERQALNGWLALLLVVLWFMAAVALFIATAGGRRRRRLRRRRRRLASWARSSWSALGLFPCFGFFTLEPNEARVLILFGAYKGTVRHSGFHWANPLYARSRGVVPGSTPVPVRRSDRCRVGRRDDAAEAEDQALAARPQLQQPDVEGQRQARQPRRDRGRRRVARRGHGAGRVRRRGLRELRASAERVCDPQHREPVLPTITARSTS